VLSHAGQVRLLLQQAHELGPAGVVEGARQPAVVHHPGDVQVLHVDRLVVADQRQGLLPLQLGSLRCRCFGLAMSRRRPSVSAIVASRVIPRSSPASRSSAGSGVGATSTTNEA
jgi:hypothetical protein